jgi:hypothetical protein
VECSLDAMREANMEKALPVTNLRKLLQDYVRQAKNVYPVCVFEVLCWAAPEDSTSGRNSLSLDENDPSHLLSQQSSPDIVIPFVMQIEIGVNAQLAHFKNTTAKSSAGDHNRSNKVCNHSSMPSPRSCVMPWSMPCRICWPTRM